MKRIKKNGGRGGNGGLELSSNSLVFHQVKEAEEIERVQRMTEDKKRDVHDELVRKAIQKEVAYSILCCNYSAKIQMYILNYA